MAHEDDQQQNESTTPVDAADVDAGATGQDDTEESGSRSWLLVVLVIVLFAYPAARWLMGRAPASTSTPAGTYSLIFVGTAGTTTVQSTPVTLVVSPAMTSPNSATISISTRSSPTARRASPPTGRAACSTSACPTTTAR